MEMAMIVIIKSKKTHSSLEALMIRADSHKHSQFQGFNLTFILFKLKSKLEMGFTSLLLLTGES